MCVLHYFIAAETGMEMTGQLLTLKEGRREIRHKQVVEKSGLQAGQKDLRGEASAPAQPSGARKIDERRRT